MGDDTLDSTMPIVLIISNDILEQIIDHYKAVKTRKISL